MSTLQSTAPLDRVPSNAGNESIPQLLNAINGTDLRPGYLFLDASYQRASVWGKRRQANLVRSLLLGIPVGTIFINQRPDFTDYVVDGKQRLEAVNAFMSGDLAVPASWFRAEDVLDVVDTEDGPYVTANGLAKSGLAMVTRAYFNVIRTNLPTVQDEADLFDLINFGGVPQGESDI